MIDAIVSIIVRDGTAIAARVYCPDKIGADTIHHDAARSSEPILPLVP